MSKIVIMESLGISDEELAARKAPFEAKGHVFAVYPKTTDPQKLIEEARDADAMILARGCSASVQSTEIHRYRVYRCGPCRFGCRKRKRDLCKQRFRIFQ